MKTATPTTGKISNQSVLYVTLPLTGVPGGLYTITIRNPDGANLIAEYIFYLTDQAWMNKAQKRVSRSPVVQRVDVPLTGGQIPASGAGQSGRPVIGGNV